MDGGSENFADSGVNASPLLDAQAIALLGGMDARAM